MSDGNEAAWLRTALAAAQAQLLELERRADRLAEAAETYVGLAQHPLTELVQSVAWYRQLRPLPGGSDGSRIDDPSLD